MGTWTTRVRFPTAPGLGLLLAVLAGCSGGSLPPKASPDQARAIIAKYRADYLLTCPDSSTTTIFLADAPKGFYGQLKQGQVPAWLTPVELPRDSPFKLWRVAR